MSTANALPPNAFVRIGTIDDNQNWIVVGSDDEFVWLTAHSEAEDPPEHAHVLLSYRDWLALRAAVDAVFEIMPAKYRYGRNDPCPKK